MTDHDLNFCARCGKPIWHSDASAIHTCTPPDKTRQGTHWDGCEETRGHHDCAIRKIAALQADLDEWKAACEQKHELLGPTKQDLQECQRQVLALEQERDALKADVERLNWLESNPRHAQMIVASEIKKDVVFYGIACDELVPLRKAIDEALKK